jgi:hypothetical protein
MASLLLFASLLMLGLLLASLLLLDSCCMLLASLLTGFLTDFGGPATGDIHVVPIVPAAAASLMLMASLL